MDLVAGKEREAVGRLTTRLLSRDSVDFNAAINSTFAPEVVYRGHGLEIRGASNIKHALWFWNTIDAGKAGSFALRDIDWDAKRLTATVRTQRYVRPRLFPFFGVAVQVPVRLHLQQSNGTAYVTRYEELWVAENLFLLVPFLQAIHDSLFKSIWTTFVLALSNLAFAIFARFNTFRFNTLDPQLDRAKKSLPQDVSRGIDTGFTEGSQLARGYGTLLVDLVEKFTYPPTRAIESGAQSIALFVKQNVGINVPYPYLYDENAVPSPVWQRIKSQETQDTPSQDNKASEAKAPSTSTQPSEAPPARVSVGPSVDGSSEGKSVRIDQRIATEVQDQPSQAAAPTSSSLFDQMRKEGQDPVAEAAKDASLAAAAAKKTQVNDREASAAASSGEDDSSTSKEATPTSAAGNGNGSNGAAKKKKKNHKKKKNGGQNGTAN